ncbi:jg23436 [Pararge aegeria aegeria]|uniref:Jg23436 protein n=1 Tax=Pararge aegeria aegeria TaxID=348720 RepID=A0A8S4RZ24_9NEOP|nr:jg23436 [Pararge aegeria aegeria]
MRGHSSENQWMLGFQGAGMVKPPTSKSSVNRPAIRCSDNFKRVAGSRWNQSSPEPWILELPTKDYGQQWT